MSQHDFTIANQTFPSTRTDLNNALAALASTSLGTTAPSTTFAGQLWYDSTNHKLMIRNEADDGWITLFTFNQTAGTLELGDDSSAVSAAGYTKEILGTQTNTGGSTNPTTLTLSESMANFDNLIFVNVNYDTFTVPVDRFNNNGTATLRGEVTFSGSGTSLTARAKRLAAPSPLNPNGFRYGTFTVRKIFGVKLET